MARVQGSTILQVIHVIGRAWTHPPVKVLRCYTKDSTTGDSPMGITALFFNVSVRSGPRH